MRIPKRRLGVSAVIGTVFFVMVFMLALGSLAYASGLQQQTAEAQESALQAASQKGAESIEFATASGGVMATNEGPATLSVNHVVLRYPNGTVYAFPAAVAIPSGGSNLLQPLIPNSVCSPGTATCLSKYTQIVKGNPPGSSVGLVTGLGNTFWFTGQENQVNWDALVGFPSPCPAGEGVTGLNTTPACASGGSLTSWAKAPTSTSGTGKYISTGLSVPLGANLTYAFYVFTVVEPSIGIEYYNFEVHSLSAGAALVLACAPLSDPGGGGNLPTNCVGAAGTPIAATNSLAFGVAPPVYATPGLFGVVTSGPAGSTLEIDIACTGNCGSLTLKAGSFMVVQVLG
jgi:hypothetical protein